MKRARRDFFLITTVFLIIVAIAAGLILVVGGGLLLLPGVHTSTLVAYRSQTEIPSPLLTNAFAPGVMKIPVLPETKQKKIGQKF